MRSSAGAVLLLVAACGGGERSATPPASAGVKALTLHTADSLKAAATLYSPDSANGVGVVLVHMLGCDRSDWAGFGALLASRGYTALAVDLRGHGESRDGLDYMRFDAETWRSAVNDVAAASDYLRKRVGVRTLYLIGGSMGANLSLLYAARSETDALVLLSPGFAYRGVAIEEAARATRAPRTLLVASSEDGYAFETCDSLERWLPDARFIRLKGAGHGTRMLSRELEGDIIGWLEREE